MLWNPQFGWRSLKASYLEEVIFERIEFNFTPSVSHLVKKGKKMQNYNFCPKVPAWRNSRRGNSLMPRLLKKPFPVTNLPVYFIGVRNSFRATKNFFITKFDCTTIFWPITLLWTNDITCNGSALLLKKCTWTRFCCTLVRR